MACEKFTASPFSGGFGWNKFANITRTATVVRLHLLFTGRRSSGRGSFPLPRVRLWSALPARVVGPAARMAALVARKGSPAATEPRRSSPPPFPGRSCSNPAPLLPIPAPPRGGAEAQICSRRPPVEVRPRPLCRPRRLRSGRTCCFPGCAARPVPGGRGRRRLCSFQRSRGRGSVLSQISLNFACKNLNRP